MDTKLAGFAIDWLRAVSVEEGPHWDKVQAAQKLLPVTQWDAMAGTPFSYNIGVECEFAIIAWHTEKPEFGVMMDMSGSRLSLLREQGVSLLSVMSDLHTLGWKITRLDLAMDVYNTGLRPRHLYNRFSDDSMKTKARSARIMQSKTVKGVDGETVYFGSRKSNVMWRVYDKAAEMKQKGDRIRTEFELKREAANGYAMLAVEQGIPRTMAALLTEQITSGMPEVYRQATDLEFEIVRIEASRDTNFERWFETTVLPAISKAIRVHMPDVEHMIMQAIKDGQNGHGK